VDEDGLHLTLNYASSSCTITDSSDTVKTFTSKTAPSGVSAAWCLTSIKDKSGNQVIFTLDSKNRPTKIELKPNGGSAIEQLRIVYNGAGKPYLIWNPTSGEGVVLRYSNSYSGSMGTTYGNYLKRVIRAHVDVISSTDSNKWLSFYNTNDVVSASGITVDAVAEYTYNYLGIITKITNTLTGYRLTYNVNTGKKVSMCREYSTISSENGQKIQFTYSASSTAIRSSGKDDVYGNTDDLVTTCTYDNCGRTTGCYTTDLNKTQIYGASGGQFVGEENGKAKNSLKSSVQTTQQSSNFLLNGGFDAPTFSQYWSTTGSVFRTSPSPGELNLNAAAIQVNAAVSSSSIYQFVELSAGEYSLSAEFYTYNVPNAVTVYMKAESQSNSAHSVTKQIPVNRTSESGGVYSASLNFSAVPSTTGGTEQFKISILVTRSSSANTIVDVDSVMLSRTIDPAEFELAYAGHFEACNTGHSPSDFWKYDLYIEEFLMRF
jgi:hypothetical protein